MLRFLLAKITRLSPQDERPPESEVAPAAEPREQRVTRARCGDRHSKRLLVEQHQGGPHVVELEMPGKREQCAVRFSCAFLLKRWAGDLGLTSFNAACRIVVLSLGRALPRSS